MEPCRNVINDPHQCRLCLRVCDDNFLESIFSEKEYSIAHQIFECTSIRVTKQDNLTKICKNCATLLFITTEFRNACFKTNRLLLEDFVILEMGEWVEPENQFTLQSCSELIVKHKQQVDYLYDSIVPESEAYLAGSFEIERELFNSVSGVEKNNHSLQIGRDDEQQTIIYPDEFEPEEPDPEIIQEITKFLESQETDSNNEFCQVCGLDVARETDIEWSGFDNSFKSLNNHDLRICEMCQLCLELLNLWQDLSRTARSRLVQSSLSASKLSAIKDTQRHLLKQLGKLKEQLSKAEKSPRAKNGSQQVKNTKRRKVACHICGKLYDSWKLKAHLNDHENRKPYACDKAGCNSAFSGVDLLNRHKKLWHSDYYYKSCTICGRKCKTQGIYKTHISYHEAPKLPCEICGKLMRNKRSMWKHMKSHENPEDRKHVCDVCNKRFAVAYTLRVHKRIHTKEKPFACECCDKQFQYNCLLKNHMEKHHKAAK
ncbi:putative zinc finger protein 735 [Sabethes cyaneus]|uniref:putative zinc finger protein 735 n=1 Tax=Sabethes cyaneus TaxID=53552 RepID=UPI00237DF6CA|nr:putative zinc finger protein 735 [Sabethes cyaneus]